MNERRATWLLIALLAAQLILMTAQLEAPGGGNLLGGQTLRLVAPGLRLVHGLGESLSGIRDTFRLHGELLEENRRLTADNEHMKRDLMRLRALEPRLEQLSRELNYTPPQEGELRLTDVIYADPSSWFRTLILYTGEGVVRRNQAVLTFDGLVGRITETPGPYAKVQLLVDRAASVGAMIARTRRQGVVHGTGGDGLEMDYVPLQADVRVGDAVISAGTDGIYPRGIPIGTVVAVEAGNRMFHRIRVAAAVDPRRLDQVYVLIREPLPANVMETERDAAP